MHGATIKIIPTKGLQTQKSELNIRLYSREMYIIKVAVMFIF
jgi:hypothetical protein